MKYSNLTKRELIHLLEKTERYKVSGPPGVFQVLSKFALKEQEHFIVLTLDAGHKIINTHVVSIGVVNRTLVHPREVLRPALQDNAASIIVAHNHPSGSTDPSPDDVATTQRLVNACEIMGITLVDHIIIGTGYYSFKEQGEGGL